MASTIVVIIYLNSRIIQSEDGVTFEGNRKTLQIKWGISFNGLKKRIHDKLKFDSNEVIGSITTRFCVALQIVDDEDVEIMINNFHQYDMGTIELCVEVVCAGVLPFMVGILFFQMMIMLL